MLSCLSSGSIGQGKKVTMVTRLAAGTHLSAFEYMRTDFVFEKELGQGTPAVS